MPDGGQQHPLGQIDPPQGAVGRVRQLHHHVEIVEREAVLGDQRLVHGTGERGVATEESDPRLQVLALSILDDSTFHLLDCC